jgi:hypothetical protein
MIAYPVVLAAGIGEILGFLVPIVFFVIYALNQLLSAKGNQPPARNAQRRAPERGERPLEPAAGPPKPQADPASQLNAEIEQFLKRATQRRGERPMRERAARAATATPKAPPKPPREAARQAPIDVVPIERRDFDAVAASVEKHLANRGFSERAEHLADEVARADEQMEQHLQQAFGHRVGTLAAEAAVAGATPVTDVQPTVKTDAPSAAASLAAVLASPQGMRQAIVLGEILARPEHRW